MSKTILLICAALVASVVALRSHAVVPARTGLAIEELRATAASRPGDPAIHNDLANLLELAGRRAEAEDSYRTALAIDPAFHIARVNLAMLLQETGRQREAKKELELVVKADPDRAWAHYQLGVIAESRGRKRAAIAAYARAFQLEPKLTFAKSNPQIVDNGLMVESLLAAFGESSPAATAPRDYADPAGVGRAVADAIRSGLEQQQLEKGDGTQTAASEAVAIQTKPRLGGEARDEEPTVLDPSAIDPRAASGQVSSPGAVSPGGRGARSARDRSVGGGTVYGGTVGTGAAATPTPRVPRGGGFRPGRLSTGRLETDVVRRAPERERPA